jgi:DNA primase
MGFIDYGELKTRVSIHDAIKNKPAGNQLRGFCPACKAGGDRALVVTPDKSLFYCFNAKIGGDQIALVAHLQGLKTNEAANWLAGTVPQNKTATKQSDTTPPAPPTKTAFDPETYAKRLDPAHAALAPLGISPEILKAFNAGYAGSGTNRGRLALRLDDRQGRCVGFIGYALGDQQPRIIAPNGVNIAEYLFNAHRVQPGSLYLVRDVLQVLSAHEAGVENVVAFMSDITAQSLVMLTSLMDTVGCDTVELF